ncbi:hypothetical protein BH23ACT3_BH23ACT3_02180 [soil metagenome]
MTADGTDLEPIEGYLRNEAPVDEAVVVVRGGPVAVEKFIEHARRQAREYSYEGAPMYSISVSLTVGGWDLEALLAGPMASRSTFATATVGAVRSAGFVLLATYEAPHYDLLLGSGEYPEAERALRIFSAPESNPFKRRGRFR